MHKGSTGTDGTFSDTSPNSAPPQFLFASPRFPGHCSQNRVSLFVFLPAEGMLGPLFAASSMCLFLSLGLLLQSTFFVFNTFWPLLQKQRGGVSRQYGDPILSVGMRLVVDIHELADRGVGVLLRGGERLVAEQLLNGAQVSAVGQQMRRKGVAQ
jgi:hypothetical protein